MPLVQDCRAWNGQKPALPRSRETSKGALLRFCLLQAIHLFSATVTRHAVLGWLGVGESCMSRTDINWHDVLSLEEAGNDHHNQQQDSYKAEIHELYSSFLLFLSNDSRLATFHLEKVGSGRNMRASQSGRQGAR